MPKKMDRRVQYTKRVLKESLADLLKSKTIEKITVKEICETADINRGTFYSHYSDQYDLYNQMVEDILEGVMSRLGNFMIVDKEEILKNATSSLDYIKQNGELIKILLEHGISYNVYNILVNKFKSVYVREIPETVDPEDINVAYSAFTSSAVAIIKYWLESNSTKSSRYVAEFAFNVFHSGFSSLIC